MINKNKILKLAIVAVFSYGFAAQASDNVPAAAQKQTLLFKGATIHTVSGENVSNANLLVQGGRIIAVAAKDAAMTLPADTKVVDVTGKHIYPGIIAANTVMGLAEVQSVRATLDYAEAGAINPNARAIVAVNPDSELIPTARANGVLAALTIPFSPAGLISGTSSLIQLDGWNWEDAPTQVNHWEFGC